MKKRNKRTTVVTTLVAFFLALAAMSTAHAGERRVVSETETVRVPAGETAVGAVLWMVQAPNVFKALGCTATAGQDPLFVRAGVINPFPGEKSGDCNWVFEPLGPNTPVELISDTIVPGAINCANQANLQPPCATVANPVSASATTGCNCPAPAGNSDPFEEVSSGGYREFGRGQETGVGQGKTWKITIDAGLVLIAQGYAVQINGGTVMDRGAYVAIAGPQTVTVHVTDGAAQLFRDDGQAQREFCQRVNLARQNNWALRYAQPLDHWAAC